MRTRDILVIGFECLLVVDKALVDAGPAASLEHLVGHNDTSSTDTLVKAAILVTRCLKKGDGLSLRACLGHNGTLVSLPPLFMARTDVRLDMCIDVCAN